MNCLWHLRTALLAMIGLVCLSMSHIACADPTQTGSVIETHLPNGLIVLTKEIHTAPVVCTYVWYRVGSRNETPGLTGISHQIEHMMFKGTKQKFPNPGYIDLLIGRHGGVNNAETTNDYTDYYLLIPSDQLDLALRIEADRMTEAAMDPQQLIAEKRVVLSELEGDENQNADYLYNNMRATAFQFHPYHFPVIGTKWDVEHFTRDQVYSYYRAHYCPNNATLVIVGDFDTSQTLARVRQLWREVMPHPVPNPPIDPEPKQLGERRIEVHRAGNTTYLDLCFHIPAANSPDLPALDVLANLLANGRSSRLYQALVEKQLATEVSANANDGRDPELFEILTTVQNEVSSQQVEHALLAELEKIQKDIPDEHELQKAKNQTHAEFIYAQDSVQSQAARLGFFQTEMDDWRNITTYLRKVNAVSGADVRRVAQTYLTSENRTVATFVPNGEKADPASDSRTGGRGAHYRKSIYTSIPPIPPDTPTAGPAQPSTGRPGAEPDTIARKLSNGLTVIVRPNHANTTIELGAFVRAGSINDPDQKYGVANLTAQMLLRGTKHRTSRQIAEATDFIGASLGADVRRERIDFAASMLSENFGAMLSLFADCIQNPSFDATELNKLKGETETGLQEEENSTASLANRRLYQLLYANLPGYAHEPLGTLKDVPQITTEELRNFYLSEIRPENMTLIVVGDIAPEQALPAIEAAFGKWNPAQSGIVKAPSKVGVPAASTDKVEMLEMKDKSQDDIAMGFIGIARNNPDYEAAQLMNLILGGDEFVGRVGKRVRDREGLAYYAYTAFTAGEQAGPWVFRAGVNPVNVNKALDSVRDEVRKMAADGVTETELAWAKDNSIGSLQLSMETNDGILAMLEDEAFYGLDLDYFKQYPHIVRSLTRAQVNAAARKYLRLNAAALVVAGPPAHGVLPALSAPIDGSANH